MPSLPADAVAASVATHVQTLKAVVDAQKAGNEAQAFTDQRAAAAHMNMVAATLTGGIAKTLPDKIGGDPASKAADLVTTLNVDPAGARLPGLGRHRRRPRRPQRRVHGRAPRPSTPTPTP